MDKQQKLRLDKYLADMQIGTRSQIKDMVRKGRVMVDGVVVKSSDIKVLPGVDDIVVDGQQVGYVGKEYYMLNKPQGVVSATEDSSCKTVLDCITDKQRKDLFPVGRLDKDTEGLLLITNDGELAHELLSPKKHVEKCYYARINGSINSAMVDELEKGVDLGDFVSLPAKVEVLSSSDAESEVRIVIVEGKFHQVKRMFESVGRTVIFLKRLSMGSLLLDESLLPGEYRKLTEAEIMTLKNR
ncbi:MAG: rRNA pseudouridine synthase [Lachnospiraceae bacterium]|nr:rRNA pseudouridine synthase [Lachnospiraceae bacterium]